MCFLLMAMSGTKKIMSKILISSLIFCAFCTFHSCRKSSSIPEVTSIKVPVKESSLHDGINYDGIINHNRYRKYTEGAEYPYIPISKLNLQGKTLKYVVKKYGNPSISSIAYNFDGIRQIDDYSWNFCTLWDEVFWIMDENIRSIDPPLAIFVAIWNTPKLKYKKLAIAFIGIGEEFYTFYGSNYNTADCLEHPEECKLFE